MDFRGLSTVLGTTQGKLNDVIIDIEAVPLFGYGYGYTLGGLDYFEVFGLIGLNYGYFTSQAGSVPGLGGYAYGLGCEYSKSIAQGVRRKKVTVTVVPAVNTGQEFDLSIYIRGRGYSDTYEGTTTSQKLVFYVYSFDTDVESEFTFFQQSATPEQIGLINDYLQEKKYEEAKQVASGFVTFEGAGSIVTADKDTFFDVSVEVKNTIKPNPAFRATATVTQAQLPVKTSIRAVATVE